MASPHTRGWTLPVLAVHLGGRGLPRTRGDGPRWRHDPGRLEWASPHTRGWTRPYRRQATVEGGFPAHAGMDPVELDGAPRRPRLPRTRGDGPPPLGFFNEWELASPHTRGWTVAAVDDVGVVEGFPAHAGMDPATIRRVPPRHRLPRTRGDGPARESPVRAADGASPHTRGWTLVPRPARPAGPGFPAHAGMDPRSITWCQWQPKTAHFRLLKTAHFRGGHLGRTRTCSCQVPPLATPKTDPRRNGVCRSTAGCNPETAVPVRRAPNSAVRRVP